MAKGMKRLKAAREQQKLSQAQLSKKSGVAQSAISHFEAGSREPVLSSLLKLAKALNVPIQDLV